MLIPSITTIRTEDFPDQKNWISRLLLPINQFLLSVTSAINGNITFGDNIPGQTQTLSFVYGASTDFPKTFAYRVVTRPVELRLCSATENGVPICVGFAWSFGNGTVSISNIFKLSSAGASELTPGASYTIILRGQP